jgi:hypothetical protein
VDPSLAIQIHIHCDQIDNIQIKEYACCVSNPFFNVYHPFANRLPIPNEARQYLDTFHVSADEFCHMVVEKELPHSRFIYLEDNKIIFDECTGAPRGEIICEMIYQIGAQDRSNGEIFIASSGNRTSLYICMLIKI